MAKEESLRHLIASADDWSLGTPTRISSGVVRSSSVSVPTCSPQRQFTSYKQMRNSGSRVKAKAPSLFGLCLNTIGNHLQDITDELCELASLFPTNMRMSIVAMAKRRKCLNDEILTAMVDDDWFILDISGSDVSDTGFVKVIKRCKKLRAVDISGCKKITKAGVSRMMRCCPSLETLRWGGCSGSDLIAQRCLDLLQVKLHDSYGECWEELDVKDIAFSYSLRWLVWPTIDELSLEFLTAECPRITINPKPEPFGFRVPIPKEALNPTLDHPIVREVDDRVWAGTLNTISKGELHIAEKFRLAFMERDARLAPKRAKNARQIKRREEKEWWMYNTGSSSSELASLITKALRTSKHKR